MAQLQPPLAFSPGQVLSASDLNAHVSSAVVLPGVITDQTALPSNTVDAADSILIHDASVSALRKATISDLLNSGITTTTGSIVGNTGVDVTITPAAGQKTQINGNLTVTGNEDVTGSLTVTGNTICDAALTVNGLPTFSVTSAMKIPVGTTAQRPGTPVTGQLRYNTTTSNTEIYNGTTWEEVGGGPFDATGGNKIIAPDTTVVSASFTSVNGESVVVTSGGHSVTPGQIVHIVTAVSGYSGDFLVTAADATTFTYVMTVVATPNSGSCTYNKAGNFKCHIFTSSGTFTATGKGGNVEVLVVGGGGGGVQGGNYNGGGGGGAVCYYPYYNIPAGGTVSVTVGNGGAANTNGTASVFGVISAGGGNTGSGGTGGASGNGNILSPSNAGGSAAVISTTYMGGGGGGAGKVGQNGVVGGSALPEGGDGGDGKGSSISGLPVTYGGGGAAGGRYTGVGVYTATGSNGGGNAGASGTANTGGGGGGAPYTSSAGSGGSGIVIVRYPYWL